MVSTEGTTFADVLKRLKEKVDQKDLGVDIRDVKETNGGLRLQVREKCKGGQSKLADSMANEMKIQAFVGAPR